MTTKPPLPPFNEETAIKKVRLAENAWNTKDPVTVSLAYTEDSFWRNRSEFIRGREEIVEFLKLFYEIVSLIMIIKVPFA